MRSLEQSNSEEHEHWVQYLGLLAVFVLPTFLIQEPLGAGSLAILIWQMLCLAEILRINSLQDHSIGPVMLDVLGSFHFFRTGHQATLSSIQWKSAFIPIYKFCYPWSPIVLILNAFGVYIVATIAVPLLPMWRRPKRTKAASLLGKVGKAACAFLLYHGVTSLGTTLWAGLLRRHLMLYRVFCPRFMVGAVVLLIVDVVSILISLNSARYVE